MIQVIWSTSINLPIYILCIILLVWLAIFYMSLIKKNLIQISGLLYSYCLNLSFVHIVMIYDILYRNSTVLALSSYYATIDDRSSVKVNRTLHSTTIVIYLQFTKKRSVRFVVLFYILYDDPLQSHLKTIPTIVQKCA